jgi:nucleotide-binding universal stress UspA family protein
VEGIVVGIDDSESSREALRWAVEEGRLRGTPVVAIHAWQPPMIPPMADIGPVAPPMYDIATLITEAEKAAQAFAERVVREVAGSDPGVEVRPVELEGSPASVLIEAAEGAELVVVGSRGVGGFRGLLLGSVGRHVAEHAPCPVVIHRTRKS